MKQHLKIGRKSEVLRFLKKVRSRLVCQYLSLVKAWGVLVLKNKGSVEVETTVIDVSYVVLHTNTQ